MTRKSLGLVTLRLTSQPLVVVISGGEFSRDINLGRQRVDRRLRLPYVYAIRTPSEVLQLDAAFDGAERHSVRDRDLSILDELLKNKFTGEHIPICIATLFVLPVLLILYHADMADVLVDKDVPR